MGAVDGTCKAYFLLGKGEFLYEAFKSKSNHSCIAFKRSVVLEGAVKCEQSLAA